METYKEQLIKRITNIPASLCPEVFRDYTIRNTEVGIQWNTDMLIDAGVPQSQLRDLAVLLENTVEDKRIIL